MNKELKTLFEILDTNCRNTISDLEMNYMMFSIFSGNAMPQMSRILKQNIENVKIEKEMYHNIEKSLNGNVSYEVLKEFLNSVH